VSNELPPKISARASRKGPSKPPDVRPWKNPASLVKIKDDDVIAVRWWDRWEIATSWERRRNTILCVLHDGWKLEISSPRQIMTLPRPVFESWRIST